MDALRKISCKNCSAELLFNPSTQMSNCNFCGAEYEIELAEEAKIEINPDGLIPFKFDKEQFKNTALAWLSEGDYTPDDILTTSVFDDVNGIYLPQYFYQGRYHGNWSASSGYNRQEEYIEWSSLQEKNVRKTRTVVDWRPSNGQAAGEYTVLGFAAEADNLPSSIIGFMQNSTFKAGEIKPYSSQYLTGFNIVPFAFDQDTIWIKHGQSQADVIAKIDIKNRVPGDKYKDLFFDLMYDHKKVINLLQPAYIIHYEFNGEKFFTYIDGDKIDRIEGTRPKDTKREERVRELKKPLKIFGGVALGLFILLIIILVNTVSDGDLYLIILGIYAVAAGSIGIYMSITANKAVKAILDASKKRRQDILRSLSEGTPPPSVEQVEQVIKEDNEPEINSPSF